LRFKQSKKLKPTVNEMINRLTLRRVSTTITVFVSSTDTGEVVLALLRKDPNSTTHQYERTEPRETEPRALTTALTAPCDLRRRKEERRELQGEKKERGYENRARETNKECQESFSTT
jgi:hypothetical protein